MLEIKDISKQYKDFQLNNISFTVEKGDYYVLLGASGMGKSMLLEIISGIKKADSGKIILDGVDISAKKIQERNIAFVFQDNVLFPHMTAFENIAFPLHSRKKSASEIKEMVEHLAKLVEAVHLLKKRVTVLSGGEAQRVALARALATQPRCLLLDEPLSNIDTQLRYELRGLLRKINSQGQTIVHVTHDYEEALSLANKIAVIENGNIVQSGTPEDIFTYPKSEFIARFIGIKNYYRGMLRLYENNNNLKLFETSGFTFYIMTEAMQGEGFLLIPAENIVVSNNFNESSSRNTFKGIITDIFPVRTGIEIVLDIGVKITSLVSKEAVEKLNLYTGKEVWGSIKASAMKFIEM